jgi:hypothetical protein
VPTYVSLIVAAYAISDSMTAEDTMRYPLKVVARSMERRLNQAGLSEEAESVAARMRGDNTGALAPVVELGPHLVWPRRERDGT